MIRFIEYITCHAATIDFPVLFIICVNDIIKICPDECNIKMFADDTLVYVSNDSSKELEHKMNIAFHIIQQWLNVNKLKMNAEKTKYMIVRSIRKRDEVIPKRADGTQIERV